jgi:hypothetical protein
MCKMVKNFILRCAIISGMGGQVTIKPELSGAYELQHEGVPLSRQASFTSVSSKSEPLTPRSSRLHLHRTVPNTLRTGGRFLLTIGCSWQISWHIGTWVHKHITSNTSGSSVRLTRIMLAKLIFKTSAKAQEVVIHSPVAVWRMNSPSAEDEQWRLCASFPLRRPGFGTRPVGDARDVCGRNRITADFPMSISVFYYQYQGNSTNVPHSSSLQRYSTERLTDEAWGVLPTKVMLFSHIGEHD